MQMFCCFRIQITHVQMWYTIYEVSCMVYPANFYLFNFWRYPTGLCWKVYSVIQSEAQQLTSQMTGSVHAVGNKCQFVGLCRNFDVNSILSSSAWDESASKDSMEGCLQRFVLLLSDKIYMARCIWMVTADAFRGWISAQSLKLLGTRKSSPYGRIQSTTCLLVGSFSRSCFNCIIIVLHYVNF